MSDYGHNAEVSGSLTVTGSSTFNEESKDVDFRVESDGNANMLVVDAGNNRVGVGTATPETVFHVEGATGNLLKLENTTAYGVAYGQLVKDDLTITTAGSSPIDTTLNLPPYSVLDSMIIKITTAGVGTSCQLTNITLDNGSSAATVFSASLSNFSLIDNGTSVVSGTMYYLNNIQPNYPAGGVGLLSSATNTDIKLDFTDSGVTTDPIVDVAVYYRKFDSVR